MKQQLRVISRDLLTTWRSSLTLRVLLTTISLSVVIAMVVGFVALTQVRDGLVEQRQQSSLAQARVGLTAAKKIVESLPAATTVDARNAMVDAVVAEVAAPAGTSREFEVLLLATPGLVESGAPERGTNDIIDTSISATLRSTISEGKQQAWQINTLEFLDGHSTSGVIVGAPIYLPGIGQYELYQLFPLDDQIATLSLMRSSILLAGIFMVVGLVAVSVLLTRQVVQPIRRAAQSAERLRGGRLTERLAVRGQDDIGRLATSFNAMAESMQKQIQRLEEMSRVQQRFVSDVSHELRTPLTTIRMASELLYASSEDFDPASAKAVQLLQQQSERFETLLNDLLEISRLDAGVVKLELDLADLTAMSARVIDSLAAVARDLSVTVELKSFGLSSLAECDVRRVERIVRNLISNSIEHAKNQPVTVVVMGDDDSVTISVRDHGSGLKPGEAALVFNRFWRADPARQRTLGGTGLGLAISLEDARIHGGWLEADGEVGRGAHFRLVLPRNPNDEDLRLATSVPLPIDEFDTWLESQS
jgi:two-component system sensor histidine kinase MtrB